MSARAFQRIFSCKIWLRYSGERALYSPAEQTAELVRSVARGELAQLVSMGKRAKQAEEIVEEEPVQPLRPEFPFRSAIGEYVVLKCIRLRLAFHCSASIHSKRTRTDMIPFSVDDQHVV